MAWGRGAWVVVVVWGCGVWQKAKKIADNKRLLKVPPLSKKKSLSNDR
jgi:G:T-mismatch repair DNA endonuclease (very short patch repair protein)